MRRRTCRARSSTRLRRATVLNAGNGQTLSVSFIPTDATNYNNASQNVSINVLKATPTHNLEQPSRHRLRHCPECDSTQCDGQRPRRLYLHPTGGYGIECRQRSNSIGQFRADR